MSDTEGSVASKRSYDSGSESEGSVTSKRSRSGLEPVTVSVKDFTITCVLSLDGVTVVRRLEIGGAVIRAGSGVPVEEVHAGLEAARAACTRLVNEDLDDMRKCPVLRAILAIMDKIYAAEQADDDSESGSDSELEVEEKGDVTLLCRVYDAAALVMC